MSVLWNAYWRTTFPWRIRHWSVVPHHKVLWWALTMHAITTTSSLLLSQQQEVSLLDTGKYSATILSSLAWDCQRHASWNHSRNATLVYHHRPWTSSRYDECVGDLQCIVTTHVPTIQWCLRLDPTDRPSCTQLLRHELFQKNSWAEKFVVELRTKVQREFEENPLLKNLGVTIYGSLYDYQHREQERSV